jgi:hypothetical protein
MLVWLLLQTDVEGDEGKHYKKANLGGANKMYFNDEVCGRGSWYRHIEPTYKLQQTAKTG